MIVAFPGHTHLLSDNFDITQMVLSESPLTHQAVLSQFDDDDALRTRVCVCPLHRKSTVMWASKGLNALSFLLTLIITPGITPGILNF